MSTTNLTPCIRSPITLSPSLVPSGANTDIKDSSFFRHHRELPVPEAVRLEAQTQFKAGLKVDGRKTLRSGGSDGYRWDPPPVIFPSLNLFVKWGGRARVAEGQSLYAIRRCLQEAVPVPEVYGWRTEGREVFLYMELIEGQTLEQAWDTMGESDRLNLAHQLRTICDNLRMLQQDPLDIFIGTVARGTLYDRSIGLEYLDEMGPFVSVQQFHDWFTSLYKRPVPDSRSIPLDPFRHLLSDNSDIKFTQGDLHRSNILVTSSTPPVVIALIDWEQAGWFPDYWEDCKARYTAWHSSEWSQRYLPIIIDKHSSTWDPWNWYQMSMGP